MFYALSSINTANRATDIETSWKRSPAETQTPAPDVSPVAYVSADVADAFGMQDLPNVVIVPELSFDDSAPFATWTAAERLEYAARYAPDAIRERLQMVPETIVETDLRTFQRDCIADICRDAIAERADHVQNGYALLNSADVKRALMDAKKHGTKQTVHEVYLQITADGAALVSVHLEGRLTIPIESVDITGTASAIVPVAMVQKIMQRKASDWIGVTLSVCPVLQSARFKLQNGSEYDLQSSAPERSGLFATEFPAERAVSISGADFVSAVDHCAKATDLESTRYALAAIRIESENGKLVFAATDSRRLHTYTVENVEQFGAEIDGQSAGIMLPVRDAITLRNMVAARGAGSIVLALADCEYSRNMIAAPEQLPEEQRAALVRDGETWWQINRREEIGAEFDGVTFRSLPVGGRFPQYRDVIPTTSGRMEVVIDSAAVNSAIADVIMVTDAESRGVDFDFSATSGTLRLFAASELGRAETALPIETRGIVTDVRLTLDPKFLAECLPQSGKVSIFMDKPDNAIRVDHGSAVSVIMPLARAT